MYSQCDALFWILSEQGRNSIQARLSICIRIPYVYLNRSTRISWIPFPTWTPRAERTVCIYGTDLFIKPLRPSKVVKRAVKFKTSRRNVHSLFFGPLFCLLKEFAERQGKRRRRRGWGGHALSKRERRNFPLFCCHVEKILMPALPREHWHCRSVGL